MKSEPLTLTCLNKLHDETQLKYLRHIKLNNC